MIKDVKLVVADIDGTLVDDVNHNVMPITKEALLRLQQHGVYLGIASGRNADEKMKEHIRDFYGFQKPFELLIGLNGGEILDDIQHTRNEYYKLAPEYTKEIIEMMEPFHLNPFIYRGSTMVASRLDDELKASSERNDLGIEIANDISELYQTEIGKIMFRMPEELMPIAEERVASFGKKPYRAFKTQTTMLEFMDARVNKGSALKIFCDTNHIPLDSVIAFGDMTNDNELLETAGWGVCLCNGNDVTKSLANDVTEYSNNEDGMGKYLVKHVLEPRGW